MTSADATPNPERSDHNAWERRGTEAVIRLAVVIILLSWCFQIVRPFVQPFVWGAIIAVATYPLFARLEAAIGGRRRLATVLYILVAFVVLVAPMVLLTGTLAEGVSLVAEKLDDEELSRDTLVPKPPDTVKDWPIVGERVHEVWHGASTNIASSLREYTPQLRALAGWLVSKVAGVGLALIEMIISIVIAGVLLANSTAATRLARSVAVRLSNDRGEEFAQLAGSTVRSVARGVLGVALIQAILAGIGFLAVGLPGAGLWAIIVLFCAVIQLPTGLILVPIVIYVFTITGTTSAIVFAIWCAFVGVSDNILKPVLLGRGAPVPMLVIFVGVIGGFVLDGIIGLFTGAVVLALGYKLFGAWLGHQSEEAEPAATQQEGC